MTLDYNILLEVAVIPLDIIVYAYLALRYTNMTPVNVAFRRFAFLVMLADIVDVATAFVTSAHDLVSNPAHYLCNILDSSLTSLAAFAFVHYIYAYANSEKDNLALRKLVTGILLSVNLLLLFTNPVTNWVFRYDDAGNYIHEFLFVPVAYGFPILFFAIGSFYMFFHIRKFKRSQIVTMIIGIIVAAVLFLTQMLFYDNVLITLFVASIGVLVIFLTLETPDYVNYLEAKAELTETKEREAGLRAKEKLSREVLLAFSKAVDAKDHYTNGHSERVARYAKEISRRMGKTPEEQEEIYELGLLHDVGKIGIAEEIINKKGKLTDEEFDVIKGHTLIGWDILKIITEIPWLSTGARWHHERVDGKGYPDGLSGEQIPEEARIICLADSYDAMTSKRSYSNPRTQEEVRKEIERCKGTQFDPVIAQYLIDMIDEDKDFKLREQD